MPPESADRPVLRAGRLMGQLVTDRGGTRLGRIADVETGRDTDGRERVVAAIVAERPWGRLLGYDRAEVTGPWLLEWFASHVVRRRTRRLRWDEIQLPGLDERV